MVSSFFDLIDRLDAIIHHYHILQNSTEPSDKFYKMVKPGKQVPLRMLTFTVYIPYSDEKIKSSDHEQFFYIWIYRDKNKKDRLFTFETIQHWQNVAETYNVNTNEPYPHGPDTMKFLKKKLSEIHAYNTNH